MDWLSLKMMLSLSGPATAWASKGWSRAEAMNAKVSIEACTPIVITAVASDGAKRLACSWMRASPWQRAFGGQWQTRRLPPRSLSRRSKEGCWKRWARKRSTQSALLPQSPNLKGLAHNDLAKNLPSLALCSRPM